MTWARIGRNQPQSAVTNRSQPDNARQRLTAFAQVKHPLLLLRRVVRGRVELPTFRFSGGRSYQLSYLTWLGPSETSLGIPAVLTGFEPATSTLTGWRALQAALQDLMLTTVAGVCPQRDSNPCRRLERAVS